MAAREIETRKSEVSQRKLCATKVLTQTGFSNKYGNDFIQRTLTRDLTAYSPQKRKIETYEVKDDDGTSILIKNPIYIAKHFTATYKKIFNTDFK